MKHISLYYWNEKENAGDYFGKWLLEKLGYKIELDKENPRLITCGSILGFNEITKNTIVWGSGFMNSEDELKCNIDNIFAVRGKLTYNKLHIDKDIVLGDLGLLASEFYKPASTKKYKYAIVVNEEDYNYFTTHYKDTRIINISSNNIEQVLDEINECEFIFSNSLHGIIFAHSLHIPAIHLEYRFIGSRDNFKFKDYYSVLDIEYTKQEFKEDLSFVNFYLENKEKYVPSNIEEIQDNLLKSFPKELLEKQQRKVFGIVSYFPDLERSRKLRIDRFEKLLKTLERLWPSIDVLIIAQNWKDYNPIKIKNNIIKYSYDKLGIIKARKTLREHFLELDYDYLIMLDDDGMIKCEDGSYYSDMIDNHPNGVCLFRERNCPLMLLSISKEKYKLIDMPNIDAEAGDGYEDDIFVEMCKNKFPKDIFHFSHDTIEEISFKYNGEEGAVPSTWAFKIKNWSVLNNNTKRIIDNIRNNNPNYFKDIDLRYTDVVIPFITGDSDLLKYCLRSITTNLKFVTNLYLIVKDDIPDFINYTKVNVIKLKDIVDSKLIDKINNNNIGLFLYNIKELNEKFIIVQHNNIINKELLETDFYKDNKIRENILCNNIKEPILINNYKLIYGNINDRIIYSTNICKPYLKSKLEEMNNSYNIKNIEKYDIRLFDLFILKNKLQTYRDNIVQDYINNSNDFMKIFNNSVYLFNINYADDSFLKYLQLKFCLKCVYEK